MFSKLVEIKRKQEKLAVKLVNKLDAVIVDEVYIVPITDKGMVSLLFSSTTNKNVNYENLFMPYLILPLKMKLTDNLHYVPDTDDNYMYQLDTDAWDRWKKLYEKVYPMNIIQETINNFVYLQLRA